MFASWKGLSLKHLGLKKGGFRRCLRFEWNTFEVAFLNVATPVVKSEWNLVSAGNEDFMVGKFHCIQVPGRPWGRHHKRPTRYSRNGRKKALQRNKAGKVNAYSCVSTSDTPKSRRNSWFYLGSSCFGSCLILRHSHFSYCMKSYTYVKMDSDIYRWWKIPNSGWERGILHLFQYALRYLHAPPVKKTWIYPRRGSIDRKCGMFAGFIMRHDTFFFGHVSNWSPCWRHTISQIHPSVYTNLYQNVHSRIQHYEFVITF